MWRPVPAFFNWEKAEERGHAVVQYIEAYFASENVTFVDLKGINDVDVMYCKADAQRVIERFTAEKVDAVLVRWYTARFGGDAAA